MSKNKSDILKQLSTNFPNFLKKDLSKVIEIILDNIKNSLKNNERVELRKWFILYQKTQKSRISRNPRTGESVYTLEKRNINFKMSKELFKIINEK